MNLRHGMALLLHAYWNRDQLLMWAERSSSSGPAPAPELRATVGELSPDGLLASVAAETTDRLWLPCDERGPLSGSATTSEPANNGAVATLVGELRAIQITALV